MDQPAYRAIGRSYLRHLSTSQWVISLQETFRQGLPLFVLSILREISDSRKIKSLQSPDEFCTMTLKCGKVQLEDSLQDRTPPTQRSLRKKIELGSATHFSLSALLTFFVSLTVVSYHRPWNPCWSHPPPAPLGHLECGATPSEARSAAAPSTCCTRPDSDADQYHAGLRNNTYLLYHTFGCPPAPNNR